MTLIERLRNLDDGMRWNDGDNLCGQAADRIEAAEKLIEQLVGALNIAAISIEHRLGNCHELVKSKAALALAKRFREGGV